MIICTNKKLEKFQLSRHHTQIFLFADVEDSKTNFGFAKLYSDIGVTPILLARDVNEMSIAKSLAEKDGGVNIVFIYSDDNIDEIFKDSTVLHVKTEFSLDVAIENHIKENLSLYDNFTNNHEMVDALSKNPKKTATMYTQNICTIYRDRVDIIDKNSDDFNYYLELNIETTDELNRLIEKYIPYFDKKEDSTEFMLSAFFSGKSMSDIISRIYYISNMI